MKKIFLYAYEQVNLGDDLFIYNIVNRYKDVQFYLLSNKINKDNFSYLNNLRVIDKDSNFFMFLSKIRKSLVPRIIYAIQKKCDAIVYIGGSIFIEYSSWKNTINWWNYMGDNFPFYVLGANFGPYTSIEYKDSMGNMFNKLKDVCFRDKVSYHLFDDINTVRYAADILFSTTMPKVEENDRKIFISVINCKTKNEGNNTLAQYNDSYTQSLLKIINDYLNNGYKVVLSGFCEAEGDNDFIDFIYNKISHHNLSYINYDGKNIEEILQEISSSSYVIGTRFHSIILGMIANKPIFPIIYSNKTLNMLKDINFQGNYIHIKDMKNLSYEYSIENLKNRYICNVDKQIKDSVNHYKKLDELLK